ncbi:GrpB family protein, partial [Brevibacillus agri]|uniref:GrpB family protein n=1 Tax=Brevibacillus agri TaxID=51101 RepID=UPI002E22309D|nr:GrpB family protein [Brevibacillus agri]MED1694305.1 GrpB family protein [Brevibacillus agri]
HYRNGSLLDCIGGILMEVISYLKYPDKKFDRFPPENELGTFFFDIDSDELTLINDIRVGIRGFILMKCDNTLILNSQLYGWVDALWITLLEIVEKLIKFGYGSKLIGSINKRIIVESLSENALCLTVTANQEITHRAFIPSQEEFIHAVIDGSSLFFGRIKEQLRTDSYDDVIQFINCLKGNMKNFSPVEKYYHYPQSNLKVNDLLYNYSTDWMKMFDKEREYLESIITEPGVVIQHIGSTTMQAVSSRPIVDILIGTQTSLSAEMVYDDLKHDYFSTEDFPGPMPIFYLTKATPKEVYYNVFITTINSSFWESVLNFRDLINSNDQLAKQFNEMKISASNISYAKYQTQKNQFITSILKHNG